MGGKLGAGEKLADLLCCAVVLYRGGATPTHRHSGYITKKVIKGIGKLSGRLGYSLDNCRQIMDAFEELEFGDKSGIAAQIVAAVGKDISKTARNIRSFEKHLEKRKWPTEQGTLSPEALSEVLYVASDTYGLWPMEAVEALTKRGLLDGHAGMNMANEPAKADCPLRCILI